MDRRQEKENQKRAGCAQWWRGTREEGEKEEVSLPNALPTIKISPMKGQHEVRTQLRLVVDEQDSEGYQICSICAYTRRCSGFRYKMGSSSDTLADSFALTGCKPKACTGLSSEHTLIYPCGKNSFNIEDDVTTTVAASEISCGSKKQAAASGGSQLVPTSEVNAWLRAGAWSARRETVAE